jgi:uncharacterized phiE125 gp8 family phage protein
MNIQEIIAPIAPPISLADLKLTLKLETNDDDIHLESLLDAARDAVERVYSLSLVTRTLRLTLDQWSPKLSLPFAPVTALTSIKVRDELGALQPIALSTVLLINNRLQFLEPPIAPQTDFGGIEIDYEAGFGAPLQVPATIRHAIRLLAVHFYENRGLLSEDKETARLPAKISNLLLPFKQWRLS